MDLITGQYEGVFKKIKVFLTSRTINIIMISINNHQLFIFLIVTRDNPFFLSIYSANSIYQIILLHLIYQLELKIFRTETIGVFTSFATLLFILLRMANFFRSFKEMPPPETLWMPWHVDFRGFKSRFEFIQATNPQNPELISNL